jgi:hypothetical protein
MTSRPQMPAFRMPSRGLLMATVGALLAVAAPATALLGLPVAMPSAQQQIDTPAGSIDASASEQGVASCADLYSPAVPALPSVPSLPVPVPAVPAVPTPSAGANACYGAGLDGAYADASLDAAGSHVSYGIDAKSPVSQEQLESTVDETSNEVQGFLQGIIDTLFGWI